MAKLLIKIMFLILASNIASGSGIPHVEFDFKGVASGGTLTIGNTLNRNAFCASIETDQGESVKSVIEKLAIAVVYNSYLFEKPDNITSEQMIQQIISGDVLKLIGLPGMYFITGTETGLGIPSSPKFLTCNYDSVNEKLKIKWDNSLEIYDNIALILKWNNYDSERSIILPGNISQYVITMDKVHYSVNDLDIWVIGLKDGLPSSPAAITLSDKGTVQQELHGIPFRRGISTNWKPWDISKIRYENYECLVKQELVSGKQSRFITINSEKPYEQVLKTPDGGRTIGIYRKFLGLKSNSTYRIEASLTTYDMDKDSSNWSYDMNICHNGVEGKDLTIDQLSGLAILPNDEIGLNAGRVKSYNYKNTVIADYQKSSYDITLPEGVDSITVWLRYSASKSTSGVGFNWIKLKEVE